MKNLVKFVAMLNSHESINGYSDEAQRRKNDFGKVGRLAMKELANLLGLTEYSVNFNPGGMAGSGDVRLMGMRGGKGVYLYINKDFGGYFRSIEHMKDFTGGQNHSFPDEDLANGRVLEGMRRLLQK